MPEAEDIQFTAYLSKTKILFIFAFFALCLCSLVFSDINDHTYYKWVFEVWAMPVRALVIVGLIVIELVVLRLLFNAFRNIPAIDVRGGLVSINYGKSGIFPISSIDELKVTSLGSYLIRVGKKKYGLVPRICTDAARLDKNMTELIHAVSGKTEP